MKECVVVQEKVDSEVDVIDMKDDKQKVPAKVVPIVHDTNESSLLDTLNPEKALT